MRRPHRKHKGYSDEQRAYIQVNISPELKGWLREARIEGDSAFEDTIRRLLGYPPRTREPTRNGF